MGFDEPFVMEGCLLGFIGHASGHSFPSSHVHPGIYYFGLYYARERSLCTACSLQG